MRLEFASPHFLYLLLLLPVWWVLVWPRGGAGVLFTRGDLVSRQVGWWGVRSAVALTLPRVLRSVAMALIVVALAEPERIEVIEETALRGRGIGLALDLSSSMLAVNAQGGSTRLEVARKAAIRFANGRPHDEMSLVAFAGQATTRVPPTTDPHLIVKGIESLEVQLLLDGTDISSGLLASIARLVDSRRTPRVMILLTDGAHNGSGVQPLAAARAAAALGVRVHTISILGPADVAAAAAPERWGSGATGKETVLTAISGLTGGRYFAASGGAALDSIYREISRIEAPVEDVTRREVRHAQRLWVLLAGFLVLASEVLFRGTRRAVVP
ncbi:MAG: VWA domain-containing protein [Gemmatimonadetes bacterium]|nr:VWA domain-containing protein [Gemmatimonadota bacterium]